MQNSPSTDHDYTTLGQAVLTTEAEAILALKDRLDDNFIQACKILLHCEGRIIVTGMGKSGHIGNKIAATLASTGSPAFFVHPAEASHGDLGMITPKDVVLALSYSGTTQEILNILSFIKCLNIPLVSLTGNAQSPLAQMSNAHLNISVEKEACPLGLAPTASTTAMLAMGDALAIALLKARGFTSEDFALSHPGGALGRRLLIRINDIMHQGDALPHVSRQATIAEALTEMTKKRLGTTLILDPQNKLVGIFTDGDIRRSLEKGLDVENNCITAAMTSPCKSIKPNLLATEALQIMESYKITALPVVDDDLTAIGIVHLHDILRAGIF